MKKNIAEKKIQNEIEKHKSIDNSGHNINDNQDMIKKRIICVFGV